MDILRKAIPYMICYLLGRASYLYHRNKYLEGKKQELLAYHTQLIEIEHALEEKDAHIRNKWQKMVEDIANYQAYLDPEDNGKWNEWDDAFFQSWKSAEK